MSTPATALAAQPLPLRHRLYARFCDGLSAAAIAREFALDRQTVTRHLRIIEEQLYREHTRDLNRLRIRALHAQYRIQSTALDALAHEEDLEAASLAAQAQARAAGETPPPLYRAQRARLLAVAAHAARSAAQLHGLFTEPSPALVAERPWRSPVRAERLGIRPAPDPAPDLPDDAYDPTDPDDLPDLPDDDALEPTDPNGPTTDDPAEPDYSGDPNGPMPGDDEPSDASPPEDDPPDTPAPPAPNDPGALANPNAATNASDPPTDTNATLSSHSPLPLGEGPGEGSASPDFPVAFCGLSACVHEPGRVGGANTARTV